MRPVKTQITSPRVRHTLSIKKVVTPKEFIRIVKTNPSSIKRSRYIIPKLGSRSLGKFEIVIQ